MKNIFSKTYKIEFSDIIFMNFEFTCLIVGTIVEEKPAALKKMIYRDFDLNSFSSLWKKIEAIEDAFEKAGSEEKFFIHVTIQEISGYLCLAIFVSKIMDSKYFILIKNYLPMWEEMISKGINPEDKDEILNKSKTLEGFSEPFNKDLSLLIRLAKIRFHDKVDFINRLDRAINYKLS
jgi:hypothetical protein